MSLFLFMGFATTVLLVFLLYTDFKWVTFLYITWVLYDLRTPLTGGRNFK
jgi:hypothetical protein